MSWLDPPRDKNFPPDAVQCDDCGGIGESDRPCGTCGGRGWLPSGHPRGRRCLYSKCDKPLPPTLVAVYCSNDCAFKDAGLPEDLT